MASGSKCKRAQVGSSVHSHSRAWVERGSFQVRTAAGPATNPVQAANPAMKMWNKARSGRLAMDGPEKVGSIDDRGSRSDSETILCRITANIKHNCQNQRESEHKTASNKENNKN